ncbi:MAG: multicopper oxidase domain-containing protein [Chloroflexi bacterium]|nr:multicopper oxidase domain-containing protein [Chloroflexota bacterium]
MKTVNRREFLKYAAGGIATLVIGSKLGWVLKSPAYAAAQVQSLDFHIGDAIKHMHTHNATNDARCYFWIYRSFNPFYLPECPGPIIMATKGDTINISVTNDLDEPHAFYVPGMYDSGPIAPGQTVTGSFTASLAGAHMYYDNLNEPVNRVMGLHGALIVLPDAAASGHKYTPYDSPTSNVQKIYDDFGSTTHFPGLSWEQGDSSPWAMDPAMPNTPPFRSYVWILHQASPKLFKEVGSLPAGQLYNPQQFMDRFLKDPFQPHAYHADNPNGNSIPQYFTINGQSGFFSHFSPWVTPIGRVGEPVVVHILNAGLWTHSMHLHANHMYVTSVNGEVQANPIWVDVFTVHPMDRVDYTVPFMRPPDFPNGRGIGMPDAPLITVKGSAVYPCVEEFDRHMPDVGKLVLKRSDGSSVDCHQRMSPLCYPMHDHSEPSQTSQGGNYNTGLISGIYFTGDRNTPGAFDFPMDEDFHMAYQNIRGRGVNYTERAAPPLGEPHH